MLSSVLDIKVSFQVGERKPGGQLKVLTSGHGFIPFEWMTQGLSTGEPLCSLSSSLDAL